MSHAAATFIANPVKTKGTLARTSLSATNLASGDFIPFFQASALDRIDFIRAGVPAKTAKQLATRFHLDQQTIFDALNLKTATVNRKAVEGQSLSLEDSERVIGLARLIGQLEAMIEESGHADGFDAPKWLSQWLTSPLPALGDKRPISLLDTMEGQALVSQMLARIQSGAYA